MPTNRRRFLQSLGLGMAAATTPAAFAAPAKKPNFVFFLADDLGWTDLGCYGSSFYESPHIDKLRSEGVKFTNAYTAGTVCSPTRASIISGKCPARNGCTNFGGNMKPQEFTIGKELQNAGYQTFFVGKWHIGATTPEKEGFGAVGKTERPKDDPKGTRSMTKAAVDFIQANKDQPFFAYVNYHAVHLPLKEREDVAEKFQKKLQTHPPKPGKPLGLEKERDRDNKQVQDNPYYGAMVEVMDQSVATVLGAVKDAGQEENTVVIFTSDNGGLSTKPCTSNLPLRAGKGWIYEGGVRVPWIVKWPGAAKAGSQCDVPVLSTDFYPTMLEIAGLPLRPKQHQDGVSFAGLLKGGKAPEREAIYWHYPHYHGAGSPPCGSIRVGDYKLVEFYEDGKIELYSLKDDLSELKDLAGAMPEKKDQMLRMLKDWQKSIPDLKYGVRGEKDKKKGQQPKGSGKRPNRRKREP